jgi:hypothetical protein
MTSQGWTFDGWQCTKNPDSCRRYSARDTVPFCQRVLVAGAIIVSHRGMYNQNVDDSRALSARIEHMSLEMQVRRPFLTSLKRQIQSLEKINV